MESLNFTNDMNMGMGIDDNTFTWEMIGLGLEEPLPTQDTIDELYASLLVSLKNVRSHEALQTSDIFRQNPPVSSNDPQVPISCSNESVSYSIFFYYDIAYRLVDFLRYHCSQVSTLTTTPAKTSPVLPTNGPLLRCVMPCGLTLHP